MDEFFSYSESTRMFLYDENGDTTFDGNVQLGQKVRIHEYLTNIYDEIMDNYIEGTVVKITAAPNDGLWRESNFIFWVSTEKGIFSTLNSVMRGLPLA